MVPSGRLLFSRNTRKSKGLGAFGALRGSHFGVEMNHLGPFWGHLPGVPASPPGQSLKINIRGLAAKSRIFGNLGRELKQNQTTARWQGCRSRIALKTSQIEREQFSASNLSLPPNFVAPKKNCDRKKNVLFLRYNIICNKIRFLRIS